jgi:Cdc6-like AAA superfamily ATPase
MKDPLAQADRTKYRLIELLERVLADGQCCRIEPVVWFPSVSTESLKDKMPNTYHREIVLTEWALTNTFTAIENAYKFYNSSQLTNLNPDSAKLIERTLAPAFNVIPSLKATYAEQEHYFLRMTNEQNGLLDYLEEQPSAVIQGGAGTGKTLLAFEKAKRLSDSGKVLFLCFNRFLMDDLRRRNDNPNISIYNLPTLSVREVGLSGTASDEDIAEYLNRYDEIGDWKWKHIVIDEGQDSVINI